MLCLSLCITHAIGSAESNYNPTVVSVAIAFVIYSVVSPVAVTLSVRLCVACLHMVIASTFSLPPCVSSRSISMIRPQHEAQTPLLLLLVLHPKMDHLRRPAPNPFVLRYFVTVVDLYHAHSFFLFRSFGIFSSFKLDRVALLVSSPLDAWKHMSYHYECSEQLRSVVILISCCPWRTNLNRTSPCPRQMVFPKRFFVKRTTRMRRFGC